MLPIEKVVFCTIREKQGLDSLRRYPKEIKELKALVIQKHNNTTKQVKLSFTIVISF